MKVFAVITLSFVNASSLCTLKKKKKQGNTFKIE